jgi:hypothetical protein
MINTIKRKKIISDIISDRICTDIQYFGEDIIKANVKDEIKELIKNSLNKNCLTSNGDKGVIIGFEDCNSLDDYYFIVFCPKTEKIAYELINNTIILD